MFTLYTDKPGKFQAKIGVEGASIDNTKVRLLLESDE